MSILVVSVGHSLAGSQALRDQLIPPDNFISHHAAVVPDY